MKRKVTILFICVILALLTGCQQKQSSNKAAGDEVTHAFDSIAVELSKGRYGYRAIYEMNVNSDGSYSVKKKTDKSKLQTEKSVRLSNDELEELNTLVDCTHDFLSDESSYENPPVYTISINNTDCGSHKYGCASASGYDRVLDFLINKSPIEIVDITGNSLAPDKEFDYHEDDGKNMNIKFDYDKATQTLSFSGSGRMEDYNWNVPWYSTPEPTNVVVNDGITRICAEAFSADIDGNSGSPRNDFQFTKHVSLPDSLAVIGERAFFNCLSLKEINLPENLKQIDEAAFSNCKSIKKVVLPERVTVLSSDLFSGCNSLEEVVLGKNTTKIGDSAFANDIALETIELPDSLETIDDYAFNGCFQLRGLKIPEGVKRIGGEAFTNSGIRSIIIPRSVTSIGFEHTDDNDGSDEVFDKGCVIYGYTGTDIEKYAKDHKLDFVAIDKSYIRNP